MRKLTYIIATALVAGATSCDIEHIDNGKLDGLWKLQVIDSLSNQVTVDMSRSNLSYAIQGNLLQLGRVYFRFDHQGDSLILHDPYVNSFDVSETLIDISLVTPFGINNIPREAFYVDELSRSKMVLRSEFLRLHFEKY
ncbi:MAG: lipocalin-like domain-containing protein [Parabacteroides sp.]|nr:lipocalin-like domain-containing protein [bacterium]MDD7722326.1 lipocalin-like domain-containing protein [bacterium]MDY4101634.1 lipocalin-like domain-containing protein [Parabacteroides sp.]MDY4528138.1 lipocalin-like domain-containing protein [Parabacteroides sp.]